MNTALSRRWLLALLCFAGLALPAQGLLPDVQERILRNGLRVLIVERPGAGAVRAQLFLRGGTADTGGLPPMAAELLTRSLDEPLPGGAWTELEPLLRQEEGAFEALRLDRLRGFRSSLPETSTEAQALEVIHQQALDKIRTLAESAQRLDAPGVNRIAWAHADYLTWGADLAKGSLDEWCVLQAERLRNPRLPWFPLDRERMLHELDRGADLQRPLSILLGTALTGRPYARACEVHKSSVEALTWSAMVTYASRVILPEHLVLVLVGDVRGAQVLSGLEKTFGAIRPDNGISGRVEDYSGDITEAPGARRLQAYTPLERRLFMAWRVPPMVHSDTPVLQVLVQMLGGGRNSRLVRVLVSEKHLAKSLTVRLGVPGGRDASLLLVEAEPEPEHALGELEQTIQGELMRFQHEIVPEDEIRRAQRQVEADQAMVQEDAGNLADALGAAQCEGGDWRLAFRGLQLRRDITRDEIRSAALRYLVPGQSTTALLEPDPLLDPQDRLAVRMTRVLTQILASRLEDPAQMEAVIRETLRQLRMLSPAEQEKTLKMLEGQVKP